LTTEEELSGLLKLALKGLSKLIKRGFKDISVEKIKQYEHNANSEAVHLRAMRRSSK
jgi:hypothetical protein